MKKDSEHINAVIYARYSSHNQTEQSIEGQLHDNYAFAEREGYNVIGEYIDRAMTGRNDQRDNFQRMISDAAKRQFQVVIVWKLDRFARNRFDSAIYKAKLKKFGVRVVSAMENLSDSPEGIILEGVLESMAEYYSANLSVNVKRGQRETLAKGKFCGGQIPYGFKSVDGKLVANERTAPVIQFVFNEYAAGTPMKEIIRTLTDQGVRASSGAPLRISTFYHALANQTYMGKLIRNGTEIPNCAEPLISAETFAKVQQQLAFHRRTPAAGKAKTEYLLQGKAFCGLCGANMVGESGRGKMGQKYFYYACSCKKKFHTCTKKNERKTKLEDYVIDQTVKYVLDPTTFEPLLDAVMVEYEKEFSTDQITETKHALTRIDADIANLVDAMLEVPKSARDQIVIKLNALDYQKKELELDLSKLELTRKIGISRDEIRNWLNFFCQNPDKDTDFKRKIIDIFIDSIYVYDDQLLVFYNLRAKSHLSGTSVTPNLPSKKPKSSDMKALILPDCFKSEIWFSARYSLLEYIFTRQNSDI